MQAYSAYAREQRPTLAANPPAPPPPRETVAEMNAKYQAAAKEVSNFLASDRGKALGDFSRLQSHLGTRLDVQA